MEDKTCAFQYAKIQEGIFQNTEIIHDESSLTIGDAKQLWDKYYLDAAKWIKNGGKIEMVIWINMTDPNSYGDNLQYISYDAESDGKAIWETKKTYFNTYSIQKN